jgi:hypothetical protein
MMHVAMIFDFRMQGCKRRPTLSLSQLYIISMPCSGENESTSSPYIYKTKYYLHRLNLPKLSETKAGFHSAKTSSGSKAMAWAWTCTTSCTYLFNYTLLVLLLLGLSSESCYGLGTFGFAIHHRFSDPVKQILGFDGHPEKGSVEYYAAMAHRDRIIRGRHLAASNNQSPLTFANGNDTASWGR